MAIANKVQPAKAAAIESAKQTLGEYNDFIFANYRGLTVEQITTLRDKLRENNATIKVIKNNFAKIAFKDLNVENVEDFLSGPTAIAIRKIQTKQQRFFLTLLKMFLLLKSRVVT